eukprot:1140275-Pelagomonas_calceolata.AAC.2
MATSIPMHDRTLQRYSAINVRCRRRAGVAKEREKESTRSPKLVGVRGHWTVRSGNKEHGLLH